ncbi:MAG: thioesterase [Oscillospiraceae bacterium]
MRYPYSYHYVVPSYDCDPLLRLKASATLRYFQEAATRHLDSLNLNYERLQEEGIVFVLATQAIKFYDVPHYGDSIQILTAPVAGRGAHMLRETVIADLKGTVLVEGQASWAMLNPDTGRPLRASEFHHTLPLLSDWTPFCDPSRLRMKASEESRGTRMVRFSDLDRNFHMNNTVYADVLLDCFTQPLVQSGGVDELFLRYRAQAELGKEMTLSGGFDGARYVLAARLKELPCFEGAFSLKQLDLPVTGC